MPATDHWQEIGWDGVILELPGNWEPRVIQKSYLLFARDTNPVVEVKWQAGHGKFDPEGLLKRLRRSLGREAAPETWILPDDLQQCLPGFQASGFRIPQGQSPSFGMLLYSRECQRTILLRLFLDPGGERKIVRRILRSLKDHAGKGKKLWAVYDIRAFLPGNLALQSCTFLPGSFTLTFAAKGMTVTLYRWKPAGAILNNQSLKEFALTQGARGRILTEERGSVRCIEQANGLDLVRAKLGGRPAGHWFLLEHIEEHNVILGVKGEGNTRDRELLLQEISQNYSVKASS